MDFPRKSFRIAVKESLQDVKEKPVKPLKIQAKRENRGKVVKKHLGSKKKKIKQLNKKLQIGRKTAKNSQNLKVQDISEFAEESIAEKVVNKQREIELMPRINFEDGWKEEQFEDIEKSSVKPLTNYDAIDFGKSDRNFKISSWSLDGVDSLLQRNGIEFFHRENSDIFCLQNLKISNEEILRSKLALEGYEVFLSLGSWLPGIAVFTKISPLVVKNRTNYEKLDAKSSVMLLEFEEFVLVCVTAPSAGRGLKNLNIKLEWHEEFNELISELSEHVKPLIITGNFQTSMHEIDVANPEFSRFQPGFTKEESEKMSELLKLNFIDTFRQFYPEDREGFSFFTNYTRKGHLIEHGSRIDYFFVAKKLQENVINSLIRSDVVDFTHSPITLFMAFQ